jgi:valyl-tRNA synthetase
MKATELDKSFNPADFEARIYALWQAGNHFAPEAAELHRAGRVSLAGPGSAGVPAGKDPDAKDNPFVVVIPPPNVTGVLHLGHGLNNSLQDVLVRFQRMLGVKTLWVPGTDHAGIATQNVVEKQLRAKGVRRQDLGREKFVEETWRVKNEHHAIITEQLKRIGSSCDWGRERFTLDEGLSKAVREVFVTLYERGLIYKGTRLVNWSTGMQSALSDDEVEFKEIKGKMYKIRYPRPDGQGFLQIATTRPETLLGDTAVAVHPEDPRYTHMIGQMVHLPLTERTIPVVADTYVDREFGTGVVKITPAHDFNDYEVGKRHNLPELNIINPDGTLNGNVPEKYRGLKMAEARKAVIADLETLGLYDGADEHTHQVGHCYRTDTVIEPYLSEQWFVRMKGMADKSLAAWEKGEIQFYPKRWENTYAHWMRNIKDWCISRQLWWGHRIPAWYDLDSGEVIVSRADPTQDPQYAGRRLKQDEDVLDTWFSSWLWPFSVMGWPEKTPDLAAFYPTTSLVTAYDIIFFWVARMIMAGLEFTGQVPFRDIYMTPLIRDKQGRKMSKSLGNGIDPLEIVDQYGADALKFTLSFLSTQGQDILMDKETFGLGGRFANKIWNASRYLLMNIEGRNFLPPAEIIAGRHGGLTSTDRWILHRLNVAAQGVRQGMLGYKYNDASSAAYEFFWNDFCDWYVEASKLSLYCDDSAEKDRAVSLLLYVLEEGLKILHPFLPLITEEIFQKLPQVADSAVCQLLGIPEGRMLINQDFPRVLPERHQPAIAGGFEALQELVRSVRALRSEFTIPPSAKLRVAVATEPGFEYAAFLREAESLLKSLCGIDNLSWHHEMLSGAAKAGSVAVVGRGFEGWIFIRDQIDVGAAIARIEKGIERESKALQATKGKLANQAFVANAAPEVVAKEREKVEELERLVAKMHGYIEDLKA